MTRFDFAFDAAYRPLALLFGITERNAMVVVEDGVLRARFGSWRVSTPLSNIRTVSITGPYHLIKTAGPARLAVTDRGLTFATNGHRGVLVEFKEPITGIDPLGWMKHPSLTVTVADCGALRQVLTEPIR
ncbi:MAG TPA: hypothetical protein VGH11_02685 [Jatrophihabitans sp.]